LYGTGEGAVGVFTGAGTFVAVFVGAAAGDVGVGGAEATGAGVGVGAAARLVEVLGSVLILGVSLDVGVSALELFE
jgi:hypothetical protein